MVSEIGSGLHDRHPKFLKLLTDPTIGVIVGEQRDRGTRFGLPTLSRYERCKCDGWKWSF